MSLEKYKAKRDFTCTSEPSGVQSKAPEKLLFVVQKHAASSLHYDFRLMMYNNPDDKELVLKSWAVPKGPSLDSNEKRLAVLVEDHPLTYIDFEGSIPEGEYGAGEVIVWDTGRFEPLINNKEVDLERFHNDFIKGKIEVALYGEKLKGRWALIQLSGQKKNWLLIKMKDEYSKKDYDVLFEEPGSVLSSKEVDRI